MLHDDWLDLGHTAMITWRRNVLFQHAANPACLMLFVLDMAVQANIKGQHQTEVSCGGYLRG